MLLLFGLALRGWHKSKSTIFIYIPIEQSSASMKIYSAAIATTLAVAAEADGRRLSYELIAGYEPGSQVSVQIMYSTWPCLID